jgi:hypothetical protein
VTRWGFSSGGREFVCYLVDRDAAVALFARVLGAEVSELEASVSELAAENVAPLVCDARRVPGS